MLPIFWHLIHSGKYVVADKYLNKNCRYTRPQCKKITFQNHDFERLILVAINAMVKIVRCPTIKLRLISSAGLTTVNKEVVPCSRESLNM